MNLLQALYGLVRSGALLGFEEARRIYRRMVWFLLYPIGLVLIELSLNLFGLSGVNIILTTVLAIVVLVAWVEPGIVLTVSGAEAAIAVADKTTRGRVVAEVKKIFFTDGWYLSVLKNVFLGATFLSYLLGTLPFKGHTIAFFGILGAVIVMGALIQRWPTVFAGHKGKKIALGYVVVTMAFWGLSLIPGPVWVKYMPFGFDPTTIGPTQTEEAVYDVDKHRKEVADAKRAKEIRGIIARVGPDGTLTPADERLIAEVKKGSSSKMPEKSASQNCGPYSSTAIVPCTITKERVVVNTSELMPTGKFQFCAVIPTGSPFHMEVAGSRVTMWSTGEDIPLHYKAIKVGELVGGNCPASFT